MSRSALPDTNSEHQLVQSDVEQFLKMLSFEKIADDSFERS